MTLPHHPHMTGDIVTVEVAANTNGQALNVWVLDVSYDAAVLVYQSISTSSLFAPAVVNSDILGLVSLSTSGMKSTTDASEVTGSDIDVLTMTFKVISSISTGTHSSAIGLSVTQMVNEFSIPFANDVTGQVNDERGGAQSLGQITVRELGYAGVFSYASVNELVNVGPLSGTVSSSVLNSIAIHDDTDEGNEDVSSSVSCHFEDISVASDVAWLSEDCVLIVNGTHSSGAEAVRVVVSLEEVMSTAATFRVWFPSAIALDVSDDILGAIVPHPDMVGAAETLDLAIRLDDTCSIRYQKAELRAYATFSTGGGMSTNVDVDVTNLVSFVSSSSTVASVDMNGDSSNLPVLQGHTPGIAEVSVVLYGGEHESVSLESAISSVQVSLETPAVVEDLTVVVFTGASWIESVGNVGLSDQGKTMVQLQHELSAEGDTAWVAIYANFDDGTFEDVSSESMLVSLRPSSISVAEASVDGSKGLIVEVGAVTVCYPAIEASWSLCGVSIADGSGVVMLDMPDAVRVSVVTSSDRIAKSGDGATLAPFSIPISVSLSVMVTFDDDSSKDFSSDARTAFEVVSDGSEALVEFGSSNSLTVLPSADLADISALAQVFVSFPGVFDLNATASVSVVKFMSLSLMTRPYPSVGGFTNDVTVLRLVSCSGVYQRLEARAEGMLSDGTQQTSANFYKRVLFDSSDASVADFTSAPSWSSIKRGLVAFQSGDTTITGSFGGLSASMDISVVNDEAQIDGLNLANDIGASGTLSGVVGITDNIKVTASFDDGTSIALSASGQTSSSWLSPSSLLTFSSAVESAISVSSEGIVKLQSNHYAAIELSATDKCGSGSTASRMVYANLEAEDHDVDLGSEIGAAFGTLNLGESFDVEVRVQGSSNYDVTAFQVVLTFDSSVIRVLSDTACVQGSDWSSSFECTTNDPVNEVQVIGSCGLSPSSGCGSKGRLAVATITFTTIAAGMTEITGDIIKIKDDNTMTQDLPIFAGADTLVVSDGGRRSLLGPSAVIHTTIRDTAVTHRRSARI